MKPGLFEYIRAETQDDAVSFLCEYGGAASVLAGGQSLVPALALRMASPEVLIDISSIESLRLINVVDGTLCIGAGCRYTDALNSEVVRRHAPLLTQAIPFIAHEAIRNRGTIGGSLAHADPASELPACMMALDATIVLCSKNNRRKVAATTFFQGTYLTDKTDVEMVVGVEIPVINAHSRHRFQEIARRSGDYAISGGAFSIEMRAGLVTNARLAFFAVSDKALLAEQAGKALVGKPLTNNGIAEASQIVADEIAFFSDLTTSAEAKRHISTTLTRRLLSHFIAQET